MAGQMRRLTPTDVDAVIQEATRRLIEAPHPQKIILFGSYARGDFDQGSDLDLLVIVPDTRDRFAEIVRLSTILAPLRFPIDLMVYSAHDVEERGHLPGSALRWALEEGRILYAASCMQPREYAREFIGAAENDLYVVDRLIDDQAAPDTMIGFHLQQATEKLLKAVLADRAVHVERTHNLAVLFALIEEAGPPVPAPLQELTALLPFAVMQRYEATARVRGLDRQRMRTLLEELHTWVRSEVAP